MASQEVFSLGTLVFDAVQFEVPEDLDLSKTTLGGSQAIPQTDGAPAQKPSQTLGVVCDTIKFDAWFLGVNANGETAEDRAQKLEALQLAQATLPFQRGARSYDVTIFHVSLKYHSANEIMYGVELEPSAETSASGSTPSTSTATATTTGATAIQSLLATAPADVRLAPASAQAAAFATVVLNPPSTYSITTIPDIDDALIIAVAAIDLLQALIGELAGSTAAADVATYLYAAELLGQLAVTSGLLGTIGGSASPGVNPGGMSVYELAVQYTGDIANADSILAANPTITDPFNLGSALVTIPGL